MIQAKFVRSSAAMLMMAVALSAAATPGVDKARELLDGYYGQPERLTQAAAILKDELQRNPKDAQVCVEVARLTIKGGHIVEQQFESGTVERYHEWLDKALKADPDNVTAHILKAEAYGIQRRYEQEKAELDLAKASGTNDPWLLIGYAQHSQHVRDAASYYFLTEAKKRGPGTTATERKAFVTALTDLARYVQPGSVEVELRELGELARKERDPEDAWVLGNFADEFIWSGMFDDAIAYADDAVKVMNYGAGRRSLAVALYAKAATLIQAKRPDEAQKLIVRARSLGIGPQAVLARLEQSGPIVRGLMPTLSQMVK